ncbi:MAG TPA: DsrE family protein [Enhygromyxa sp.]|nr:DsrE family protein [Enhygromyxa sp.]
MRILLLSASLIVGGAAGVVGVACMKGESPLSPAQAGQQQRKVVINLMQGTNDLRAASMALALANELLERGAEVTVYANLEGVRMVDARQPDQRCGYGMSVGQLYQQFLAGGGTVLVCPLCAELAGIRPENLREGSRLANLREVADAMLAADQVIDY